MKFRNCFSIVLHLYFLDYFSSRSLTKLSIRRFMVKPFFLFFFLCVSSSTLLFGTVDSLVYSFSFSDTTRYDKTLSTDIDLKTQAGKILLASGDQKNLVTSARVYANYVGTLPPSNDPQKPDTTKMNPLYIKDNNYFSVVSFPTPNNIGSGIKFDLNGIRKVTKIIAVNLGNAPFSFNTRPIAFSYYAGIDSTRLGRIYQEFNNTDSSRHTAYISEPQPVQFLSFVIDKQDPRNATVISEFQIFGEGYVEEGTYVSAVDSVGIGNANFANTVIDADIVAGTYVSVEFRTGSKKNIDSLHWSNWSSPIFFHSRNEALAGSMVNVAEPRRFFQYRIKLYTTNLETPKVSGIKIVYQKNLVVDSATVFITPQDVPVLSPVMLTYTIQSSVSASSLGIDTIKIATPGPSVVRSVTLNGTAVQFSYIPAPDKMVIGFPQTLKSSGTVNVTFSTKMITGGSFPSVIISKSSPWNPQRLDPSVTAAGDGWLVNATGVPITPLVDVRIDPNPFTPNDDGKNDATIIDFSVANISSPKPLRISIMDLTGRKVRTLVDIRSGINPFFGDPRSGGKGFLWDGRDDNGKKLLPGLYIVQISLDVDNGGQVVTKSVVIAY